jgi:hypothetical protein
MLFIVVCNYLFYFSYIIAFTQQPYNIYQIVIK